ncbi:MAG TPA: recombinase RecA [Patescibacteria group bacterium]
MAKKSKDPSPEISVPHEGGDTSARNQALEIAIGAIQKQFGQGAIMRMGGGRSHHIASIPTGSLALDVALGIGGLPRGRIVEIYGPESSGKTTLTLSCIAQTQKKGGLAAFVDAEHAFDPEYARKLGVNLDELLISQPDTGEQALEIVETLVRSNALDIVVVDSVAALVPRSELEGDIGDASVGVQARLMSQALRKITGAISKSKTIVVFINQIRMKIGVMFGNPETTSGGNALKFYASVRMDIRRGEQIKEGDVAVGNRTKVKIVKNKVAPPFRVAEFDLLYAEGISREGDILDLAVGKDIVQRSGSWYQYEGEKIGQGRESARTFLKNNPSIADEIEAKIRKGDDATPEEVPAAEIAVEDEDSAELIENEV